MGLAWFDGTVPVIRLSDEPCWAGLSCVMQVQRPQDKKSWKFCTSKTPGSVGCPAAESLGFSRMPKKPRLHEAGLLLTTQQVLEHRESFDGPRWAALGGR